MTIDQATELLWLMRLLAAIALTALVVLAFRGGVKDGSDK